MKQKADGTKRARINVLGYQQIPGVHYDKNNISSPVVNEASIFIILILIVMARMYAELNDVRGAFLKGLFSCGKKLYMRVPQGFEVLSNQRFAGAVEDYLWIEAECL